MTFFVFMQSMSNNGASSEVPSFSSRLTAAIWGQFLGDAAALGTHWIYDLKEMASRYKGGVQGFEKPAPGHYHHGKESGDQTHYGDAALLLLESLAACGGHFREADFAMRLVGFFGSQVCNSYIDKATKATLDRLSETPDKYQNGAYDDQMGTVSRLAPLVTLYATRPVEEMLDAVRRLTLVTQSHPTALGCAAAHAMLLRGLLEGAPFLEAFEQTRKSIHVSCDGSDYFEFAYLQRHFDTITATEVLGQGCSLPQGMPAALHAACRYHEDFTTPVMGTILAGGDNAGRASMIGAWMGALLGVEGLPHEWLIRLRARSRIQKALNQLQAKVGIQWSSISVNDDYHYPSEDVPVQPKFQSSEIIVEENAW
jgi:ADP-ribosylglycohydrolase